MSVGYLGNKLKKEPNTLHCDKSGCRRFKVTQTGLKMKFELVWLLSLCHESLGCLSTALRRTFWST